MARGVRRRSLNMIKMRCSTVGSLCAVWDDRSGKCRLRPDRPLRQGGSHHDASQERLSCAGVWACPGSSLPRTPQPVTAVGKMWLARAPRQGIRCLPDNGEFANGDGEVRRTRRHRKGNIHAVVRSRTAVERPAWSSQGIIEGSRPYRSARRTSWVRKDGVGAGAHAGGQNARCRLHRNTVLSR